MFSYNKISFLLLCVTLHFVNINSGANSNKKSVWKSAAPKPNFDPEYPQFTPFNSDEFVRIDSDVSENEQIDNNHYYQNNSAERVSANDRLYGNVQFTAPIVNKDVADLQERLKPLKNLFMGLYQNYKSSYVGNKTIGATDTLATPTIEDVENRIEEVEQPKPNKVKRKKSKKAAAKPVVTPSPELKYNVGPGVNLSLDSEKELVNVYLDEDCLKDVFTGTQIIAGKLYVKTIIFFLFFILYFVPKGRGKKYDLISKILPLFILPFLIQSAIVPFVVSSLKLLLIKSIIVGKIAIFLLVVSAFKNHVKYSYDGPPSYYVDPPSRRSEATVGYRVEGKPTTWIN